MNEKESTLPLGATWERRVGPLHRSQHPRLLYIYSTNRTKYDTTMVWYFGTVLDWDPKNHTEASGKNSRSGIDPQKQSLHQNSEKGAHKKTKKKPSKS
jgi:hypothetical protein